VIVGNYVAGSVGESTVRVGGANDFLIADNNITDTVKGTIAIQAGTFGYVYGNTVNSGPIGVGPLGVAGADPNASFTDCVFDSNNIFSTLLIQPGSDETMVKNNVIHEDGASGITINGQGGFNWEVQNVYIQNNTVIQAGPWAGFLALNGGAAVNVNVNNNLLVAPDLQTGSGQGIIIVDQNDLSSFGEIQNNVWAIPTTSSWSPDGYFYVDAESGQQDGYLSPAQWEALGASGDVYENVTLGSTYSVEIDGFTAGSPLSTGS
jgi:Right handed beta helix region